MNNDYSEIDDEVVGITLKKVKFSGMRMLAEYMDSYAESSGFEKRTNISELTKSDELSDELPPLLDC